MPLRLAGSLHSYAVFKKHNFDNLPDVHLRLHDVWAHGSGLCLHDRVSEQKVDDGGCHNLQLLRWPYIPLGDLLL
jgi:hypothetical protein